MFFLNYYFSFAFRYTFLCVCDFVLPFCHVMPNMHSQHCTHSFLICSILSWIEVCYLHYSVVVKIKNGKEKNQKLSKDIPADLASSQQSSN